MNAIAKTRGRALEGLPAIQEVPSVRIPKPRANRRQEARKGKVKASFFLIDADHEEVLEMCQKHNVSQQQIFEEALDLYFRAVGKPGLRGIKR